MKQTKKIQLRGNCPTEEQSGPPAAAVVEAAEFTERAWNNLHPRTPTECLADLTEGCTPCANLQPLLKKAKPVVKHSHYFKDVSHLDTIDVYRVLDLYNVTDPCIQHAVKKLLVAGGRGAGKDANKDIQEAIDTLERWQEMCAEDKPSNPFAE